MRTFGRAKLATTAAAVAVLATGVLVLVVGCDAALAGERSVRKVAPPNAAVTFRSYREAYNNGISAFRYGNYAVALPALEYAAQNGWIPAKFYLAQIFDDNLAPYTDHARAYNLYREIVDTTAGDTDPDDYVMAPILAQSLVAVGRYTLSGLPAIGLKIDKTRAAEYFSFAGNRLNDADAQYELAKLLLVGDGVAADVPLALHFFALLVKRGHTSAQASMAELLAQGRYVKRDLVEALAMIDLARRNAPERDAPWIADIHQRIYCGASPDVKQQASGLVGSWQQKYGRPSPPSRAGSLGFEVTARRECQDGGQVPNPIAQHQQHQPPVRSSERSVDAATVIIERQPPVGATTGPMPANAFGFQSAPRR